STGSALYSAEPGVHRPDHMETSDPHLTLKVSPPRISRWVMDRPQLDLAHSHLHDHPIIKLEAPGGFGKSSLLCQWRRQLLARGAVVAWLTVDATDDPARFTQGLSLAMERASGRAAFARLRHREAKGPEDFDRLTEWLGAVADTAPESVLMLD